MKFGVSLGVYLPGGGADPGDWVKLAQAAERTGFDSIWTGDHIVIPEVFDQGPHLEHVGGLHLGTARSNVFEPLMTYAYLAGQVGRIKLGLGTLILPYRDPLLTAKMLTMLDVLSGGRLILGIGTGWLREEFTALRTPPYELRGAVTDEYIELFIELWTKESPRYSGRFVDVSGIGFLPKPVQRPHPPIWIGGNSKPALRRLVKYGQGWLPIFQSPAAMVEGIARLRGALEAAGRDPSSVDIALGCRFRFDTTAVADSSDLVGTPQHMIDLIRRYEEIGVTEIHLLAGGHPTVSARIADWERFAELVRPSV